MMVKHKNLQKKFIFLFIVQLYFLNNSKKAVIMTLFVLGFSKNK